MNKRKSLLKYCGISAISLSGNTIKSQLLWKASFYPILEYRDLYTLEVKFLIASLVQLLSSIDLSGANSLYLYQQIFMLQYFILFMSLFK